MEAILATSTEVAEGVATAPAAMKLAARHGVSTPIIDTVALLVTGTVTAREALVALLKVPIFDEEA